MSNDGGKDDEVRDSIYTTISNMVTPSHHGVV